MRLLIFLSCFISLSACQSYPPVKTVDNLDLPRFMGDWYVIAHIPLWAEKKASKAIEQYRLNDQGIVETSFSFIPEGKTERKQFTSKGFPQADKLSIWGMQFIWPFKADYRIAYVDEHYQYTLIARNKRDYLWLMARQPTVNQKTLNQLVTLAADLGYDVSKIRMVPQ